MKLEELLKKYSNLELTEKQEEQIKDLLGIREPKRWKPHSTGKYYYVNDTGGVSMSTWNDFNRMCEFRYKTCNVFKTKEEAEFRLEQIKVYYELENFANANNEGNITPRYSIELKIDSKELINNYYSSLKELGQIYFTSKEILNRAVEKIGYERIRKYLFGVE